jgi:histidinol-phosphate/aromatic aminotransferase/cobyric acid decarboxylase-like protein
MAAAFSEVEWFPNVSKRWLSQREDLKAALKRSGFEVAEAEATYFLWIRHPQGDAFTNLARLGILGSSGTEFESSNEHARLVAATSAELAAAAVTRLELGLGFETTDIVD